MAHRLDPDAGARDLDAGQPRPEDRTARGPSPAIVQAGFCTPDIASTMRRYTEDIGFGDAGGDLLWGDWLAQMQEVPGDVACTIWWATPRHSFFQLEFFQHTVPRPSGVRPWSPEELGWFRMGIAVPHLYDVVERLRAGGVSGIPDPAMIGGVERTLFSDPETGVAVELFQDGPAVPGGLRARDFDLDPAVVYVSVNVSDLDLMAGYFRDVVGFEEVDPETVHSAQDEVELGFPTEGRRCVVFRGGNVLLEVVRYAGAEHRDRRRLIDHGMMNVAVGFRQRDLLDVLIKRIEESGGPLEPPMAPPPSGAYFRAVDGTPLELISIQQERDADFGWTPRPSKLRPQPLRKARHESDT